MNFCGGATNLDPFLEAKKTSQTKGSFPYERFDEAAKLQNKELPPYDIFFSKLRSSNPPPLPKQNTQITWIFLKIGMTTDQAETKFNLRTPPPAGIENYEYQQIVWEQEQMSNFTDFLRCYKNNDVFQILEAMQKLTAFDHCRDIDSLKLSCKLPNLAKICLHKSTHANFYPFTERDKNPLEQIREDVGNGPSVVFTRKTVVDGIFIRKSEKNFKSVAGSAASQLYPYPMCKPMPTGLYTRRNLDPETGKFTTREKKTRSFQNKVMPFFQRQTPECKIEKFYTTDRQKKIDCFTEDGFCSHCKTTFEAMCCFYTFCPCQEVRPPLTEEHNQRGTKKRDFFQQKGFTVTELWKYEM